jgi:hypothetical protein
MNKNKRVLESNIFQLTVAYLSNNEKPNYNDKDLIEFNDEQITFEMLKEFFYDNNFGFFEINEQYSYADELMILNKTIKNYETAVMKILDLDYFKINNVNRMNFIDILNNKFISNKKVKVDNVSKISLIKDVNSYNSLYDFKIYNQSLNLNDIISRLYQNNNKYNKTHLRIKIIANYYSLHLNEEVNMCFNYLVEIPKDKENGQHLKNHIKNQQYVPEEEVNDEPKHYERKHDERKHDERKHDEPKHDEPKHDEPKHDENDKQFINMIYSEYNDVDDDSDVYSTVSSLGDRTNYENYSTTSVSSLGESTTSVSSLGDRTNFENYSTSVSSLGDRTSLNSCNLNSCNLNSYF